jgi:hypothetical protein
MSDTFTTNFNLTKPEVGSSTDTWGAKLNADLDTIDAEIKEAQDAAAAVSTSLADFYTKTQIDTTLGGYYTKTQMDTSLGGKANTSHTHTIANVTGLQAALDGKLPLAGGTMTGLLRTQPLNSNAGQSGAADAFRVQNVSGTGDASLALMSFLCNGTYGINMHLRSDGYFGIGGWSRPAWSWYTDPNGQMVTSGNIVAYSDPRLKDDVEVISGALDIVDSLRGVRFTWNGKTKLIGRPGFRDIGILADEVEAVLPEIVSRSIPDEENDGEQWRVVAYDKLTPVLIEAIKELRAEVRELRGGR